jgi:glucose/arabinose dehydrogenase
MTLLRPLLVALVLAAVAAAAAVGAGPAAAATPAARSVSANPGGDASAAVSPAFRRVARVQSPTALTYAPGPKSIAFVTERRGLVRVLVRGRLLRRPFLDIRKRVRTDWVEQGLLGLAFPPDYRKTRRFYVFYTTLNGDIKIDEFKRSLRRPLLANPASQRTVLRIPELKDGGGHNGGAMRFLGPLLFITVGDGGNPGDEFNQAQDLESLRGKILRIDPRQDQFTGRSYGSPPGNPYLGGPGRDEIYAYGFRNPHALNFYRDQAGEPQVVVSDVGQLRYEEINNLPLSELPAANFGWKIYEGNEPYNCGPELCPGGAAPPVDPAPPVLPDPGLTWPDFVYPHTQGCAVIGGPVIRDPAMGDLTGRLIAGDFCVNRLLTFDPTGGLITDRRPLGIYLPPGRGKGANLNGFGEDGWGRVYLLSNFGGIYRLTPARQRRR